MLAVGLFRGHVPNLPRAIYEYTSSGSPLHRHLPQYQRAWSTFQFSQHAVPIDPLLFSPYTGPASSVGGTPDVQILSIVTGYHSFQRVSYIPTCSCLLSDVSRINHSEDLGTSISPPSTEISGIAAFQLDSSYFYQGFRCSTSSIV